jgi:putative sigma-54 modulation protein
LKIIITGKNIELTPSLKDFVEKKMDSIKAYVEQLQEVDVILSVDKTKSQGILHTAEVTIWATGVNFRASQSHPDMYAAIDLILDKLQKQIKRYKDKLKQKPNKKHKRQDFSFRHQVFALQEELFDEAADVAAEPVKTEIEETEDESSPKLIRTDNFFSKPMFPDEAAIQLRYLQQEFIVFNNADTGEVNVVYRRNDGNVGLIEPSIK